MEIIDVSKKIQEKINLLVKGRALLKDYAKKKAENAANYELAMAKTLIGLKNGKEFKLGNEIISNPPASIMEKVARGICYLEKLRMETDDLLYKNAIVGMQAIQSEMNGYQSIFRYMEHEIEGE